MTNTPNASQNFGARTKAKPPSNYFDLWVSKRDPAAGTIESWSYVFDAMNEHFIGRSAASISSDEAQAWLNALIVPNRSALTGALEREGLRDLILAP